MNFNFNFNFNIILIFTVTIIFFGCGVKSDPHTPNNDAIKAYSSEFMQTPLQKQNTEDDDGSDQSEKETQ